MPRDVHALYNLVQRYNGYLIIPEAEDKWVVALRNDDSTWRFLVDPQSQGRRPIVFELPEDAMAWIDQDIERRLAAGEGECL